MSRSVDVLVYDPDHDSRKRMLAEEYGTEMLTVDEFLDRVGYGGMRRTVSERLYVPVADMIGYVGPYGDEPATEEEFFADRLHDLVGEDRVLDARYDVVGIDGNDVIIDVELTCECIG